MAAVNRFIVSRNFVTGERNILIFSQVCRKANLMSKDKKKSKVKQISIAKHLLKEYNVSEWSPKPRITAHKASFLRNSDFGHLRPCKLPCPRTRKSTFCTVLLGLAMR